MVKLPELYTYFKTMIIKHNHNCCRVDLITKDNIIEICSLIKTTPLARPQDCTFEFICSTVEKEEVKNLLELRENSYIHTIGYIEIGTIEDKQYFLSRKP